MFKFFVLITYYCVMIIEQDPDPEGEKTCESGSGSGRLTKSDGSATLVKDIPQVTLPCQRNTSELCAGSHS